MTAQQRLIKHAPYLFTFQNAAGGITLAVGDRPYYKPGATFPVSVLSQR